MFRLRIAAIFLLLAFRLAAQTPDTATLLGHITDTSQGAIADVDLVITNGATALQRSAKTDASGNYAIAGLPVEGTYSLRVAKPSFVSQEIGPLSLRGGVTATVDLVMSAAGGRTELTVTGSTGSVRTDGPQLGVDLSASQINETPLLNRRVSYLPLLNAANRPAISQGDVFMNQNLFTTNGAGRRQTWFEVDGTTGNDSWGRQTMFTNIPLMAVGEMVVLTNGFSAEYGGGAGSAVDLVTRSGSNQFHGDGLALWRPSQTAAALSGFTAHNAANGNDLTSDLLGQGALSLAGPIGSGKRTQFFAAGEFSAENRASPVTSPVAPGSFVGHYRNWLGFLRLDHQIGDRHNLFFRSDLDGFYDTNPNGAVGGNSLPSVGRVFRRRTYSEALGETATLTPSSVNSLRLQFQLASPITEFDPIVNGTQYSVPISTGGTFVSGTSQSALLMNRQYQVDDTLSVSRSRQQIRMGGSMIYAHNGGNSKEFGGPIYDGQFVYNTCIQPLSFCESPAYLNDIRNVRTYTQSYGNANYLVDDVLWSVFIQDDIRLRTDLTINVGLRYERQTFTDAAKNFAPRVGFAYNWLGNNRTVIRGGFGIYYSQIVDNSAANYALTGPTGVFNYIASSGQTGFPVSVGAAPLPAFPAGAVQPVRSLYVRPGDSVYLNQFFPTSTLVGYPNQLLNPYTEQWSFGMEQQVASNWVASIDYIGSHSIHINRPLDVDAPTSFPRTTPGQIRSAQAANCARPYWIDWYAQHSLACNPNSAVGPQPPYSVIQTDAGDGYAYYDSMNVNVGRRFTGGASLLASYTWSHAIDNVDPDVPGQNPNDARQTGRIENGNAIFDQRHRFVLSGTYTAPWEITVGGIATLASGLPFNYITGTVNSGNTGATTDRPVINGVVVGRNTGRGNPIYDVSPFAERRFALKAEQLHLRVRAEAFNVFNHANFVGYSGTYGNGVTAGPGFGQPLAGITNQLPARSFQFSVDVSF